MCIDILFVWINDVDALRLFESFIPTLPVASSSLILLLPMDISICCDNTAIIFASCMAETNSFVSSRLSLAARSDIDLISRRSSANANAQSPSKFRRPASSHKALRLWTESALLPT